MKKLIAAVMLSIYLFNIGGQLIMRQYFAYLSDRFFNEQTSKGFYNVSDLTEVKIPVNMPSVADWPAYEDIAGQIKFGDNSYNYVKMKITRTAIYLMCVPNYATTHLSEQNIIGAKNVKGAAVPEKNHVPYSKTTLLHKFDKAFIHFEFNAPFKTVALIAVQPVQQLFYHSPAIPEQPPRSFC